MCIRDRLSTMGISKNNSIVPINIEVNELDKQAIVDALVKCEKNIFRQYAVSYTHLDVYKRQTKHRVKRLHLSFWCKRDSWAA